MLEGVEKRGRLSRWVPLLVWLVVALVILAYRFYILPRKGIGSTDPGFYLYAAWAGIKAHVSLDPLSTLISGVYVNSLFMKLGIYNYLQLRFLYLVCAMLASTVFLYGLCGRIIFGLILPISLLSSVNFFVTPLLGYHEAPILFLMIAMGVFYFSMGLSHAIYRKILYCFSSLLFILSAFSSFGSLPAALLSVLLMFYFFRKERGVLVFFVASIAFLLTGFFIWKCLFVHMPALSYRRGVGNIEAILNVFIKFLSSAKFLLFYVVFAFILRACSELSIFFIEKKMLFRSSFFLKLVGSILDRYFLFLAASIFLNLTFMISVFHFLFFQDPIYRGFLLTPFDSARFALSFLALSIFLLPGWKELSAPFFVKRLLPSLFVFLLYWFSASASSTTHFEFMLVVFASPMMLLSIVVIFSVTAKSAWQSFLLRATKVYLFVLSLLCVVPQLTYAYHDYAPYEGSRIRVNNLGVLDGLYLQKNNYKKIVTLQKIYNENNCANKYFVAFNSDPFLYYFFQHPAPLGQSWFPRRKSKYHDLLNVLGQKKGWCVFVNQSGEKYGAFVHWLKKHSRKTYKLKFARAKKITWDTSVSPYRIVQSEQPSHATYFVGVA